MLFCLFCGKYKLDICVPVRSDERLIEPSTDTILFVFHNFARYDILVFFVLDHLQFCCGFIEKFCVYNKLNSTTSVYLNAH